MFEPKFAGHPLVDERESRMRLEGMFGAAIPEELLWRPPTGIVLPTTRCDFCLRPILLLATYPDRTPICHPCAVAWSIKTQSHASLQRVYYRY